MNRTLAAFFFSFSVALCLPLGAAQKPAAVKAATKAVATPVAKSAAKPVVKPAVSKTASSKSKLKTSAKSTKPTPTHVAQQHPATERYTEIQQALVDRGYLMEATGTWGPESVAALKKFQEEHGLPVDGKLGALSLTALGLGPRRGGTVADAITAGILQIGSASTPLD